MVTVDQLTPPGVDVRLAARAHRSVEPLHSHHYFSPELDEHLAATGLRPGRMTYFAGRAAPMGAVSPGVVTATFYNFAPGLVARHVPRCWTLASPEAVVAARFASARASLTRLLGDTPTADVVELGDLLAEACTVLTPEARPLYAGHADLEWPTDPVTRLWHAVTLLREHRGDGHLMALQLHGLTGLEALVTHTVTGRGFTVEAAQRTRGWSPEEWAGAVQRLTARGLLDEQGLTEDGVARRAAVEEATDMLSVQPFEHLGVERTERVVQLAKNMARTVVAAGAYPAGVLAGGSR
ncbi:hypothetical protein SAMN03159343_0216 [Klenkia marina]|uniref:SalK n=1 Tax=Klenkia marina TaxID=1960309 RepID=A0A1G4XAA8_9ACTN|nr:hypothetical protein [Klenkia marina]SCX37834.1 hypothetical protein SAMN03159343_0216 [Klenkia marina]